MRASYSNWDEYTRRQYVAKAPHLNPYGTDEEPRSFRSFDVFLKIRVLHQLTVWTFFNPDRMRDKMSDEYSDYRQTEWVRRRNAPKILALTDVPADRRIWLGP
jgi:hypothetical protein